jgi:hypothetical protein
MKQVHVSRALLRRANSLLRRARKLHQPQSLKWELVRSAEKLREAAHIMQTSRQIR